MSEKIGIDVYDVAREVFDLLEKTTDRLIEKKIDFKSGEFYVVANSTDLHQVFLNLGTNSAHAIEEKGISPGDYIKLAAEEYKASRYDETGLPEGEYIHICFEDTGVGMTDEVMRKAFDPLFTTKRKSGKRGQGLGLAMVYNIISRMHGGYVAIESEIGRGTVFHIYFRKAYPQQGGEDRAIIELKGGSETVLVVDDEEMVLKLAERMLKKLGYSVIVAYDGEDALKILKKNMENIEVIILDFTMPKMSGQMVLRKIRELKPDVKVIISSGHSDEYVQEEVLSHAKGFMRKPYKLNDLAYIIRTAIDNNN